MALRQIGEHQFGLSDNRGQDAVEFMRHSARQFAHGFHFLSLKELCLQPFALRDIPLNGYEMGDHPVNIPDRSHLPFKNKLGAVFPIIDCFTGKRLTTCEVFTQPFQHRLIRARALQQPGRFARHLRRRIAGHLREGGIAENDARPRKVQLRIGDEDGLPRLLHRRAEQPQRFRGALMFPHLFLQDQVQPLPGAGALIHPLFQIVPGCLQ